MKYAIATIVALSLVTTALARDHKAVHKAFIVRVAESQMTLKAAAGPVIIENCAVVFSDGHLSLELRRQESLGGDVTIATYESELTGEQIERLRRLLDAPDVKSLPPFVRPNTPMTADGLEYFKAQISRDSDVQNVGFFNWHGNAPTNPESDRRAWQDANAKLQPLAEWFHYLKLSKYLKWRRVPNAAAGCGIPLRDDGN